MLWTTKEWEAWPRGISKAAARVLCDPLFFFICFPVVFELVFNVAWPHKVAHHSIKQRLAYIAARLVFITCLYAVVFVPTGITWTHFFVSRGEALC